MRGILQRLPKLAALIPLLFSFVQTPLTYGAIVNSHGGAQLSLTKDFRETYLSNKILEHGVHSIFHVPNLSKSCFQDIQRFITQVLPIIGQDKEEVETEIEAWALQMLDSWAKIPEGILSGHVNALGDFDECLAVRATQTAKFSEIQGFQGKYCLVYVIPNTTLSPFETLPKEEINFAYTNRTVGNLLRILSIVGNAELPLTPSIGSCLPSTCSDQEILQITTALLANINLIPVASFCSIDEPPKFSPGAIGTISGIAVLFTCVLLGTLVDLAVRYDYLSHLPNTILRVIVAFSIVSNGRKFMNTNTGSSDVSCLHGIRFLSASWVVLGHTYLLGIMQPLWNIVETYSMITSSLSTMVILNAAIVVDVFFVLGGFLVSLTLLAMLKKAGGKINLPMLYFHRYFRITPLYMIIVCLGTFVFPLLGSGPYWHVAKTWAGFCEKNWWKNILYINNLPIYDTLNNPTDAPCHGMAWYLGVDMQLFLLSPFLLYPVWRWKKYGQVPLAVLTIMSVIIPGLITYINNYLPTSIPFKSAENKYSQLAYTPTYMRAAPYLIGMCTGVLFHSIRNKAFKLKKKIVIGAWLVAFAVGFTVLLSPQKFYDVNYEFKKGESAIFVSGHRTAWSLAVSWLIFACGTGYGGWINQFLSWRPFVPLGRLTFSIYLVSMHLQFLFHLQYRQPINFGHYHMVNLYFAHLVMSCLVAVACTLVIEAPLMQLLKIALPTKSRKPRNDINGNMNASNKDQLSIRIERCSVSPAPSALSKAYGSTSVLT